jgi:hypothetical protein
MMVMMFLPIETQGKLRDWAFRSRWGLTVSVALSFLTAMTLFGAIFALLVFFAWAGAKIIGLLPIGLPFIRPKISWPTIFKIWLVAPIGYLALMISFQEGWISFADLSAGSENVLVARALAAFIVFVVVALSVWLVFKLPPWQRPFIRAAPRSASTEDHPHTQ